jgi:hypothetical protein
MVNGPVPPLPRVFPQVFLQREEVLEKVRGKKALWCAPILPAGMPGVEYLAVKKVASNGHGDA